MTNRIFNEIKKGLLNQTNQTKPVIPPRQSTNSTSSSHSSQNQNALVPSLSDTKLNPTESSANSQTKTESSNSVALNTSSTLSETSTASLICDKSPRQTSNNVELAAKQDKVDETLISAATAKDLNEIFTLENDNKVSLTTASVATVPNLIKVDVTMPVKSQNGFTRKPTLTKVAATATTFSAGKITSTSSALNRNTSISLNSNPLSSSSSSSSTSSTNSSTSTTPSHFNANTQQQQQQHLRSINKQPIMTEL